MLRLRFRTCRLLAFWFLDGTLPARDGHLFRARHCELARWCITRHRAAGTDRRSRTDGHRRYQLTVRADEGAIADDGLVFVGAVVVAGDRPRADIYIASDDCIAEIAQMIRLRAFRQRCVLGFDEVAYMRMRAEYSAGAQTRVRPNSRMRPDPRTIDMTERQHLCIGLDVRVFEHTMCADAGSMLELHCSFEDAIDVDADIRLAVQLAADIDARWIGERDAALEQAGSLLPLINALELGQLRFAVHAQNLEQLGRLPSTNRRPVGDRERHYVGQVELALRVVIADFGQPPFELGSRRSENSGVDFRNTFLRGGGIALLDDAAHFTALSYDASVAGWIWRRGSNQQQSVLAVQHALQGRRSDEWNVAVEHQR